MQHLDEGTIHAWLDGELPSPEREAAEAHVAACAQCRAALAEARGFIAASTRILTALDSVPGGVLPANESPVVTKARGPARFTISRAWMAAAAVLVLSTVTVIATRPGRDAANLRVAAATGDDKMAGSAGPFEEKPQAAAPSGGNAPSSAQSDAAPAAAAKAVDQNERLKSRLEAERQSTKVRTNEGAPPVPLNRVAEQPAAPPAPSALAKDAVEDRAARVARYDSMREQVAAASGQGVSVTGRVASEAGVPLASDSASADSAAPRLLSRNTMHVEGDTVVTSVYSVRGVSVSHIDHSSARDEAGSLQLKSAMNQMPAKSRAAAAAVNSITWLDSIGHSHTLRGPLTPDQLEQLKKTLFGATR